MPANKLLLLGAGFSRNWSAPLASEVASSLLARVGADPVLQPLLKKHAKNFELALAELQELCVNAPSSENKAALEKLQAVISDMFNRLNATLKDRHFEFVNDRKFSVAEFLARFASIFNLNQDLLLELLYEPHVLTSSNGRKSGLYQPALIPVHDPSANLQFDKHLQKWSPSSEPYREEAGAAQPHYKLHGSSNWHTNDGRRLLIMGGDKASAITQHEILGWYAQQFSARLAVPNTHLMVIGYSFSDQHINDAILTAWNDGTLTGMFIVDPRGLDVLPDDLTAITIMGISTRLMSDTFAGDEFEHQNFLDFLNK